MSTINKIYLGCYLLLVSITATANSIIDLRSQTPVNQEQLATHLISADYVLLGELHDNPHHHEARGQLIAAITSKKYAAVVEYLPTGPLVRLTGSTLQSLEQAGFSPKAWPWKLYQPLFEAIRVSGLPLYGSNLDRSISKTIFSGGSIPAAMESDYQKSALTGEAKRSLENDLIDGHCGKLPTQYLEPMFRVQRLTDISMAQVMMRHSPAILFAGNGHVRNDYGVPQVLRSLEPSKKRVSVGFVEEDRRNPKALAELAKLYDFVWISPSIERADPCATLHFGKSESSR
ncbi:ChaN family lipoprotein [Polynucleobacter sp. HIN5]|uniref:ChaN family lipoprotein n=1 Tax=Polynucleobacter sp. HIN5 TaxID=3047864 RepID=UPI0025723356|nr:ChaN family lipoprotein [Polynucleobacter sp. HIN5]BEI33357.1 ChaN family lipoprotein [Polynucleobacter sp. HIN5]